MFSSRHHFPYRSLPLPLLPLGVVFFEAFPPRFLSCIPPPSEDFDRLFSILSALEAVRPFHQTQLCFFSPLFPLIRSDISFFSAVHEHLRSWVTGLFPTCKSHPWIKELFRADRRFPSACFFPQNFALVGPLLPPFFAHANSFFRAGVPSRLEVAFLLQSFYQRVLGLASLPTRPSRSLQGTAVNSFLSFRFDSFLPSLCFPFFSSSNSSTGENPPTAQLPSLSSDRPLICEGTWRCQGAPPSPFFLPASGYRIFL